ncbi:MAG: hypothetical protein ACUZ8N_05410 [Candidatus Scalindua sp.]
MDKTSKLIELAKKQFGSLSKTETRLFTAVLNGKVVDYSSKAEKDNDPSKAMHWSKDRVLKADRISWLCLDPEAVDLVSIHGIIIKGAHVIGNLSLPSAKIPFQLHFEKCAFPDGIDLRNAQIARLSLIGTHTGPINAAELKVTSSVLLRDGFKSTGIINLLGAKIGGNLECSYKCEFINPDGASFAGDLMTVEGNVFFSDDFLAQGEVRLYDAKIEGSLTCNDSHFINKTGKALNARRLEVNDVLLRKNFRAQGEVSFYGAKIGGDLDLQGAHLFNENSIALNAAAVTVKGSMILSRYLVDLDQFTRSSSQVAVLKGESEVNFKAYGEVVLMHATIDGNLECNNGQFINPNGSAITADSIYVKGNVFLSNGFKAEGKVSLHGSTIGGNLECEWSQFINQKGYAINAYRMEVKGSVVFRKNVTVKGEVNFDGAKVEGHLYWRGLTSNKDLKLNLKYARIGILADDISSWPEKNNLFLSGLIYDEIDVDSPLTVQDRIEWLHLQPTNTFYPQPYEQLASILRKTGREEDAKKVLIEKNRDTALCSQMSFFPWIWHKTKGGVIGYGHRPSKALPFVIGIILLGWLFFGIGFCTNVMTPTNPTLDASANKEPQHVLRGFSKTFIVVESLAYSIDRFVPIVDFNVASNWQPDKDRRGGRFIRVYMWFHIAMGWILTSFLVAAMTGLIRG